MAINNELITKEQTNLTWNLTFKAPGRLPIIADRVFKTLDDATNYVNDTATDANAYPGLILSVVADDITDNNGVYYVSSIPTDENEHGELVKVGNSNSGNTEEINTLSNKLDAIEGTLGEWSEGVGEGYTVIGAIEELGQVQTEITEEVLPQYGENINKKEDKPSLLQLSSGPLSLNELILSGKYIISGGLNQDLHKDFPILTSGNINAELTVYANDNKKYISQFMKFDNVDGGDCNLYTRVAINGVWENWQKIQGVNEVNLIGFGLPKNFDNLTESGMYSGVNCYSVGNDTNGYPITRLETFVLIVINADLPGLTGGISQLKYSLAEGNTTIMTRTKVDEQWSEWKNVGEFDVEGDRIQTITWGENSNMNDFIEKGDFICNNASIWANWKPQNLPINPNENIYISFNLKVTEVESIVTNGTDRGINHTVGQVLTLTNGTTRTTDIYIREYEYYTDNNNTDKDRGVWTEWRCLSSKEQGINAIVEDGVLIL